MSNVGVEAGVGVGVEAGVGVGSGGYLRKNRRNIFKI